MFAGLIAGHTTGDNLRQLTGSVKVPYSLVAAAAAVLLMVISPVRALSSSNLGKWSELALDVCLLGGLLASR